MKLTTTGPNSSEDRVRVPTLQIYQVVPHQPALLRIQAVGTREQHLA